MSISGPEILVRALSKPGITDRHGNAWNYHGRSDRHSKIACWGIVFDLLRNSRLLREHIAAERVAFGINVEIRDFQHDRKKDLDLVICQPASGSPSRARTLTMLADHYQVELTKKERAELRALPELREAQVGSLLVALEAKACMTAHQRALPRLYDELNSSHATVHGAHDLAIAAGFVMINSAETFLSPDLNKQNRTSAPVWSTHDQPKCVNITMDKIKQLPRRSKTGIPGYDALAMVVVDCKNDGSAVRLQTKMPAPQPQDAYHYSTMIDRLQGIYATRFSQI